MFQTLKNQVGVLQIFEVFEDRLSGVKGFCAPGQPRKFIETPFDGGIKSDGKHE